MYLHRLNTEASHLQEPLDHGNPCMKLPARSLCADVNEQAGLELWHY